MRILVCGSRHFDDWNLLNRVLYSYLAESTPLTIIEGGAKGADFLARVWAKALGIDWVEYPADWNKSGKAAGPIRNQQMLDEGKPDLVVAFLAPNSRGTKHMISIAQKAGIPVKIVEIE